MQALQTQRRQGAQRVIGRRRPAAQQQSVSLQGSTGRQRGSGGCMVAKTPQGEESEVWVQVKPPTGLS